MSQPLTQKASTPMPTMVVHLPPQISSNQVKIHSKIPDKEKLYRVSVPEVVIYSYWKGLLILSIRLNL